MDRRFSDRYQADFEVRVTVLGGREVTGSGFITDISESGIGVNLPVALRDGEIVQLQVEDSVIFGFVIHASSDGSSWQVGIEAQRVLVGKSDLSRLLHVALRRALPKLPGVLTATTNA